MNYYTLASFSVRLPEKAYDWFIDCGIAIEEDAPEFDGIALPNDLGGHGADMDYDFEKGILSLSGHELSVEALAEALRATMIKFDINEPIGFCYANTADKEKEDAFSGGMVLITKDLVEIIDAYSEMKKALRKAYEDRSAPYTLDEVKAIFQSLDEVEFDGEYNMLEPFRHFSFGVNREEIWKWLESLHPEFSVADELKLSEPPASGLKI